MSSGLIALNDELSISRLLVRERWYRDTEKWEQLRSCYHPETSKTRIKISWIDDTADAFVRRSRELTGKGSSVIHTITPAEITVHQEKAIAEAPASIMIRFEKDEHQYELISNCRLMYRLSRVDEVGWKINELTVIYVRDMIVPVAPMATSFSPDLTGFRGSYKFLTWTLQHRQVPISQELPGVDRPDTIVHLQEEQTQWLCAP